MAVGFLPALGSGIRALAETGQQSRLIDGYLRPYADAFGEVSLLQLPARVARRVHERAGSARARARARAGAAR